MESDDDPTLVPSWNPTVSPVDRPTTDMPSPFPTTEAPMTPSSSPTFGPTRKYSTSDFIVELIEWSNVDILGQTNDPTPQYMSANYHNQPRKTFAPTPRPTSSPSTSPTLHPVTSSPTLHPTPPPVPTVELILPSLGETTISSSRPNDNFGSLEAIAVTSGNLNTQSDRFDSLLLFDVSLIDPSMEIMEATLQLYNMNSCSGGGKLYHAPGKHHWDELEVNWNTAPQAQGIALATIDRMVAKSWSVVDLTSALSFWNEGYHSDKTWSLRIMSLKDSLCMFAGGEEWRPRIVVRYAVKSGIQMMSGGYYDDYGYDAPNMSITDELESITTSSTTTKPAEMIMVSQTAEQIILATADASLSNIRQFQNFGTQNAIVVDGGDYASNLIRGSKEESEQFDALIQFDLSSIRGDVEDVVLRIHVTKGCEYGGDVFMTEAYSARWKQDKVTWKDAPRTKGESIGSLGRVEASEWYNVDLSSSLDISSSSLLTLRLSSKVNTRCMYTSVDRGDETAPRLIVKIRSMVPQSAVLQTAHAPLNPTQDLIPTTGNFILIVASDDATIDATRPNSVKGDDTHLYVDYNERSRVIRDTLIRFDLSQMQGGDLLPRSALLTLFTESRCENAGTFMSTEGEGDWTEDDVTWTLAPNFVDHHSYEGGHMIGTFGAVESGRWYGFSVVDALLRQC